MEEKRSKSVAIWLLLCSIMVIIMVGIGGFTRLTKSGLSITEWKPITGILPPLNQQDWVKEKLKYEATPEYKTFNQGMSIAEFKTIYLTEYIHRLAARLTGLIFIVPFVYFVVKKRISGKEIIKLSIVLLLGALQALAGWYMVKSGLVAEPHVSHYRLALHLLLALIIFALLMYQFFDYQLSSKITLTYSPYNIYYVILILILVTVQIIFGAFVAGLNAGLICNTFPLMDGHVIPEGLFFMQPIWLNIVENRITVQFIHRILALLIFSLTVIFAIKNSNVKQVYIMLSSVIIQVILGIATLLLHIPIAVAVAHQVFSFILFASCLYSLHSLRQHSLSKK